MQSLHTEDAGQPGSSSVPCKYPFNFTLLTKHMLDARNYLSASGWPGRDAWTDSGSGAREERSHLLGASTNNFLPSGCFFLLNPGVKVLGSGGI